LYSKETEFLTVLRKKIRTILLPYILWNALGIIFYYVVQSFSFTKQYFTTAWIRNFNFWDWLGAFTGKSGLFKSPIIFQFWFLRDLFILDLLFLLIKGLVDKFPAGTIILFFIFWVNDIKIYIVSPEALFFFSLGYYIIKYSLDYKKIDNIKMYDIISIYLLTIIIELFFNNYIPIIHKINIVIGSIIFLRLTYNFTRNVKLYTKLIWLEKYAFFVYAIHGILLTIMTKLSLKIIPMKEGWILLQYFSVNIIGIIIFVIIGVIVKRLFPGIYTVLTGGRI
jgi:hypothetical protein